MPHIVLYCPILGRERKAACVAALTRAFSESTGIEPELLVIHVQEHSCASIGVGGRLLSDVHPELLEREQRRLAQDIGL